MKMKNYYIYKTTNLVNGLIYIGQRSSLEKPEKDRYLGSGIDFQKALIEFGRKKFFKEILQTCLSKNELNNREKFWVKFFKANSPKIGYNLTSGGTSCFEFSLISNEKKSKSMLEFWKNDENRKKQILGMKNFINNNPEFVEQIKFRQNKRYEKPEERELASERRKNFLKDHPEYNLETSRRQTERYKDLLEREKQSQRKLKYLEEHPEALIEIKLRMSQYPVLVCECGLQTKNIGAFARHKKICGKREIKPTKQTIYECKCKKMIKGIMNYNKHIKVCRIYNEIRT